MMPGSEQTLADVNVGKALEQDPRELVVVAVGDSLSTVFLLLQKYSCLVAPVYNAFEKKWVGFIDVVDVLTTLLSAEEGTGADEEDDAPVTALTAKDAVNRSNRHPFLSVKDTDSLYLAAKTMVENKVHYLAVFNEKNKLVNVLDEWEILNVVFRCLPAPRKNPKVSEFGNFGPVPTVKSSEQALGAFNMLIEKNYEFAAVVNDDGKLMDSLSGYDSKLLNMHESTWLDLYGTVLEYLRKSADTVAETVASNKEKKVLLQTLMNSNCVYAPSHATWADVCTAMVDHELMHVYIAEEDSMHPVGMVGLHDMLKALI